MFLGYQRELSYQRYDGSFSAFGNRDSNGSMWYVSMNIHVIISAGNQELLLNFLLNGNVREC